MATFTGAKYAESIASRHAESWLNGFQPANLGTLADTTLSAIAGTAAAKHRLLDQMRTIDLGIVLHGRVMTTFYVEHFMAITIATGAGVLAAAILFVLSGTWITNRVLLLRVSFVCFATIAAFFGTLLASYQYSKNAADNCEYRQSLVALRYRVHTYCATGQDVDGKPFPLTAMLHSVDHELEKAPRIAIGFDEGKIRYTDLLGKH